MEGKSNLITFKIKQKQKPR